MVSALEGFHLIHKHEDCFIKYAEFVLTEHTIETPPKIYSIVITIVSIENFYTNKPVC